MKRVLLISPYEPSNSGSGVHKRLFNHIRALERHAKVDLYIAEPIPTTSRKIIANKRISLVIEILKTLWRREKFLYNKYFLNKLHLDANGIADYDVIYFFRLIAGAQLVTQSMKKLLTEKEVWIDFDDIESQALSRASAFMQNNNGFLTSVLNQAKIRAYKSLENKLMALVDIVIVCSEKDKLQLEKMSARAKVVVIPNVIDFESPSIIEEPKSSETSENDVIKILFVGTMSYDPNIDAANFFVTEIYPLILESSKRQVELFIVGFEPPDQIRSLNDIHGITVTGGVDSVAPYYGACDFVIAPIRFGGGTRIKILEAYTYSRAVVSTPLGCEGLSLEPNVEILIAETPREFAQMCLSLIDNPTLKEKIASSGSIKIRMSYSIASIEKAYKMILN